jgi:FAD/FMN-containing dehydrogenase
LDLMTQNSLIDRLCSIAGEGNVSLDPRDLQAHSRDPSPFPPITPGIVVTPTSTEIVSQIVEMCNETKSPILPFGEGYSFTGLSNRRGSSTIVMDMKKMNRIIKIDESNCVVRSETGVIVGNLSDQVKQRGYYLNTVAVPYYKDTLGGMISGVVAGGHPLYSSSAGLNNMDIVGLRVVLPQGAIVETNGSGITSTSTFQPFMRGTNSPDMTGMFVGDAGIFGIKTEAIMAMHPIPPFWSSGAYLFTSFDDAYSAICEASHSEELLCDYLTILSPEITEIYTPSISGHPTNWGLTYYAQGFTENDVDVRIRNVESIVQKHGGKEGTDALIEFSEGMRTGEVYWKINEYTETMIRRASCAFFASSGSFKNLFLKIYSLLQDSLQMSESSRKFGLTSAYVIHSVLQNSLWANVILNYDSQEAEPVAYRIIRDVHRLAAKLGATFETHGGYAADLMGAEWSEEFRGMMMSIKKTLDPNGVLNPGLWFSEV